MSRKHAVELVILFCMAITLVGFVPRAAAQDDDDPPSRVARLSYAQGSVSFQPAGTDDWVMAGLNRPVTTGDRLWSDQNGRVELQLDGSLVRLSNDTGFSFLNLNDNATQIQLTVGTLLVQVRRLDDNETYEIDTPNVAFTVLRPGLYRISVNETGDSTAIKIRTGQGEVTGGGAAYSVHANDYATFSGTDQLNANSESYGNDKDQFDSWAANRDRRWENSNSARYVSPDVVGYEDLDDHGSWRQTPDYGNVWFPRTSVPGWAPYHYGHWDYIAPWGYTWVDDEPWGFAPFHYGRWVSYRGSWGWVPAPPRSEGVVYVRPVYAPALVAWVGGPQFAIGIGGGGYAPGVSVGWFALGPREVYVPSYRVSRNYVNNVNVSNTRVSTTVVNNYYNTTIVNNNVGVTNVKYVNQSVRGAVAATTPQAFTSAQPVARNTVRLDQREVERAPVRAFTPSVVPAKQAVLGTGAAAAKPPTAIETRAVVAKVAPPPPPPSFEKRQQAIKSNGGRPLSAAQVQQIEPADARRKAPVRIAPAPRPAAPMASQGNRPGQPQNGQPQNAQPAQLAPNAGNRAGEPANHPANSNNAAQPTHPNPPASANSAPQAVAPATEQPSNRRGDRQGEHAANPNNDAQPAHANPSGATNAAPQTVAPNASRPSDRSPDRTEPATNTNPTTNKPGTPNTAQPSNGAADRPGERTVNPTAVSRPAQPDRPVQPVHPNEIPAPPRPTSQPSANAVLDRKHQQQEEQLRTKQEQERQKVQQQQDEQHAKLERQQVDDARKHQLEQQHQQQTQQLQQKQAEQQKVLQGKQQKEAEKKSKPQKDQSNPEGKP